MVNAVLEGDLPAGDAPEGVAAEKEIVSLLSRSLHKYQASLRLLRLLAALDREATLNGYMLENASSLRDLIKPGKCGSFSVPRL